MPRSGWAYVDLDYFKELGGPTGSVQFLVSETQLSGSQYFVYSTASNNIGIGLTSWDGVGDMDIGRGLPPADHKVQIVGDVSVTGSIYADNYIIKSVSFLSASGDSDFGDSSGDYHAFTGSVSVSEKVGIGTPTPGAELGINGDLHFQPTAISTAHVTTAGSLRIRATNSMYIGDDDADSVRIGRTNSTAAKIHIRSGTDNDLIVSNSKVGIGTATPSAPLDVYNTSTQLRLSYDASSYATLSAASDSSLTIASAESGNITLDSAGDIVFDADGGDVSFKDGGTAGLVLDLDTTSGACYFQNGAGNAVVAVDDGDRRLYFYDKGGEHIAGDGSHLTLTSGGRIDLIAASDVIIPSGIGLHFDGTTGAEKIESDGTDLTITSGAKIILGAAVNSIVEPATDNNVSLGSPSKRWSNVYTGDLHLKNERGDWTIVEEAEYLTLVNNANGKKYKIMMEEIED